MKIAVAQMQVTTSDFLGNLKKAEEFAKRASLGGAQIVVFPEMFLCGFNYRSNSNFIKKPAFDIAEELKKISQKNNISICGTVPFSDNIETTPPYNRMLFIDKENVVTYDKVHLFSLFNENRHISKGSSIAVFEAFGYKIGFAICYDLRFPELFRKLAEKGAELIIISSAWPKDRKEHFEILSCARAIENQCYIALANQFGKEVLGFNTIEYFGGSAVINPWGECLAKAADAEDLIFADLDKSYLKKIRSEISVMNDRRLDLY